jgi:hypothetical protein
MRVPHDLVGDFNVAPLECDVWSHKQLLNVVSHTPVEVEALTAPAEQRLGRSRPPLPPGAGAAPHLVELPLARLDEERPRPAARPYVGDEGRGGARGRHHVHEPCRNGRGRPTTCRSSPSSPFERRRDVARAIDALRRGWPVSIDGTAFLAVETADEAALAAFDAAGRPTSSSPATAR